METKESIEDLGSFFKVYSLTKRNGNLKAVGNNGKRLQSLQPN